MCCTVLHAYHTCVVVCAKIANIMISMPSWRHDWSLQNVTWNLW